MNELALMAILPYAFMYEGLLVAFGLYRYINPVSSVKSRRIDCPFPGLVDLPNIVVVQNIDLYRSGEEYVTSSGDVARRPIRIYGHHTERTWAHEIGLALGDYLGDRFLPDLYPYGFPGYVFAGFEGDIGNWGLMGDTFERWPVHPCSWTKERLGWLRYRDIELSDLTAATIS